MIVTAKQMKEIEANANAQGISYQAMMENAGSQAAEYIRRTLKLLDGLQVAVFCGKGNNGGDGYVTARRLAQMGCTVSVVLCDGEPTTPDALLMYRQAKELGLPLLQVGEDGQAIVDLMEQVDVVVDAMYGSGFHGQLDELHQALACLMNQAIAAVFSLDIPSGISCDSGEVSENAVVADFTIVFDSLKPAHLLTKLIPNLGRVVVADIGIPQSAHERVSPSVCAIGPEILEKIPQKPLNCHKTSTGKVLNIAGSYGMAGAAVFSGQGVLRSGAGYLVTLCPRDVYPIIAAQLPQSTYRFWDNDTDLRPLLGNSSAVAIGCGLGQGEGQRRLLQQLLENARCPVVIDADGINNLSRSIEWLQDRSYPLILTPHAGEMATLCHCKAADVLRRPIGCAQDFAREHNVILLLKGANTVVCAPDGRVAVNNASGSPGLAKAGSGDVLTGILLSLLNQGMEPFEAAQCAVYLHGLAGDRCAQRLGIAYMQPDDILSDLGQILLEAHGD